MPKQIFFFFGLVLSCSAICQTTAESISSLFEEYDPNAPGVTITVIKDGQQVYHRAYGMANLEYQIPLSTESVFDIASLAKQFTGYAIAKLELEGQLDMDDPISDYSTELPLLEQDITIGHLIHHSSGLRDIGELFDIGHYGTDLTAARAMKIMSLQRDLNFAPSNESDYSNTNYVLLAKIVEAVTGSSFDDWCQEHIFKPIGMTRSFANDDPRAVIADRAVAYYSNEQGYSYDQNNGMALIGSSAIYSSATDLSKWAMALLTDSAHRTVFDRMQTKGMLHNGDSIDYGYGIGLRTYKGQEMIVHSGATPAGFRTSIAILPDDHCAIVLLSNLGNIDLFGQFEDPILELLFGDEPDLSDRVDSPVVATLIELTDLQLDKFVGTYLFNEHMKVQIERGEQGLTVQPEGAPAMPLIPLAENQLDFPGFKSILTFADEIAGEYQHATIMSQGSAAGQLQREQFVDHTTIDLEGYSGQYYAEELDLLWSVEAHQGKLSINDSKKGVITFIPLTTDRFKDESGQELRIKMDRDAQGDILGFSLSRGSRLRGLKFARLCHK